MEWSAPNSFLNLTVVLFLIIKSIYQISHSVWLKYLDDDFDHALTSKYMQKVTFLAYFQQKLSFLHPNSYVVYTSYGAISIPMYFFVIFCTIPTMLLEKCTKVYVTDATRTPKHLVSECPSCIGKIQNPKVGWCLLSWKWKLLC